MTSPHDDSRLTAYALGELPEIERAEVEALIADDFEAQALVAEIQSTARFLAENLQNEAIPGLAPEQRQAIETCLETPRTDVMKMPVKARPAWARLAIAAGLIGVTATLLYPAIRTKSSQYQGMELALKDEDAQSKLANFTPSVLPTPSPTAVDESTDVSLKRDRRVTKVDLQANGDQSPTDAIARPAATPSAPPASPAMAPSQSAKPSNEVARNEQPAQPSEPQAKDQGYPVNPFVDNSLGRKTPVVVGTSAGGIGNFTNNLNAPGFQPGQSTTGGFAGGGGGVGGSGNFGGGNAAAMGSAAGGMGGMGGANPTSTAAQKPGQQQGKGQPGNPVQPMQGQPGYQGQAGQGQRQALGIQYTQGSAATIQPFNAIPQSDQQLGQGQKPGQANQAPAAAIQSIDEGFLNQMQDVNKAMIIPTEVSKSASSPKNFKELSERRKLMMLEREKQQQFDRVQGGDAFSRITDNAFLPVEANPLSTFSIDVDTASYSNVRRFITQNTLPPGDAVRIEELINYFPYSYPQPRGDDPFSVNLEVARCPWDASHRLVRIGLKGREIDKTKRPPSNLVFLIDVSGSMNQPDKLPLLKAGMKLLVDQLGENDRVAIVVYAGMEGLALSSTSCSQKEKILSALEELQPGGSTNGGRGIQLAYDIAVQNFIKGGTNRVILATDGDFNVGVTEGPALDNLIIEKRKTDVFLSVLGFGQGNVKHDKLESLADKGNGQYSYIDTIKEARKVLGEQISGTLVTIAKDVKIQVKFNPARTASFRLIGYENRMLQAQDFANDKKDAGEIGAGHCVTALYELVPPPKPGQGGEPDKDGEELLNVDLRYKAPDGDVSKLISFPAIDQGKDFAAASEDYKFAASVAGFGMLLRNSPYKGTLTWTGLNEMARAATGPEPTGYRQEFLELIGKAQGLDPR